MADEAVRFSVEHNIEREAVIDRRALEAGALQQAMGRADLDGIRERRTEWEKRARSSRRTRSHRASRRIYDARNDRVGTRQHRSDACW